MTNRISRLWIWPVSASVLVAGIALTCQSARRARTTSQRSIRKLRELNALRGFELDLNRCLAARQAFEALENKRPVPLARSLKDTAFESGTLNQREVRRDTAGEWVVRQKEIAFDGATLATVIEFVRKVEAQRPPWRLKKCVLSASSRPGEPGHAVLLLEALEKRQKATQ